MMQTSISRKSSAGRANQGPRSGPGDHGARPGDGNQGVRRIPLLGKGGVAAPINKMLRSHLSGRRRGGSFYYRLSEAERTTPAAPNLKVALHLFVRRGDPSFTKEGSTPIDTYLLVRTIVNN